MSFPWPQWTDRLKELHAMFLSASEMADRLTIEADHDCSRNAVIGKLKRLGLCPQSCPARGGYDGISFERQPRARAVRVNPFNPPLSKVFASPKSVPPLSPDQKEYILGKGISLIELKPDSCRWPINAPARWGGYLFCGATIETKDCPYCGYHARIAYGRAA